MSGNLICVSPVDGSVFAERPAMSGAEAANAISRAQVAQKEWALGVENPDIDQLVKGALADPSREGNPIKMTADNTRALINACL